MDHPDHSVLDSSNKERLRQAAEMLIDARRTLTPIDDLPPELRPKTMTEAYYVQDVMLQALGASCGWKVGAPTPDGSPLYAPMPLVSIGMSGGRITSHLRRMRGVEAELAFLLGKDLPPRSVPYSRTEVIDAIASCHPAIELLESALINPDAAERLTMIADLQSNGGFAPGDPVAGWQEIDLALESAQMNVDGFVRVSDGKNPAGADLLRLVVWLANEAQPRTGGLLAGQWITTGSWTGKILADSGSVVVARFPHFGEVNLRFD